jgi:hypothetical protein
MGMDGGLLGAIVAAVGGGDEKNVGGGVSGCL